MLNIITNWLFNSVYLIKCYPKVSANQVLFGSGNVKIFNRFYSTAKKT